MIPSALTRPVFEPPVDVPRDEAARAAREELSKRVYHQDEPGVVSRVLDWVFTELQRLLLTIAERSPGGMWGLLALVLVLALAIVVVRWRIGPLARARARAAADVFAGRRRSAAEHRADADAAAGRGDYETAVRERFRAIVRDLEERTILDERPGRTADEAALEVAAGAPEAADRLRSAALVFDEVCYGGRPATPEADSVLRAADDTVRGIRRLAPAGAVP